MLDKEIIDIGKLMEMPEFETLMAYLEKSKESCNRPCEFYAQDPDKAHFDFGRKTSYESIILYLLNSKNLLEKYAEER